MKVGGIAPGRAPAKVATPLPLPVDGVGVDPVGAIRKESTGDLGPALPAPLPSLHSEVECKLPLDDLPHSVQTKHKVVTVGSDFNFGVLLAGSADKELDHLVVPQPPAGAGGTGRRRIGEKGRIDTERETLFRALKTQCHRLTRTRRKAIPRLRDAEIHRLHAQALENPREGDAVPDGDQDLFHTRVPKHMLVEGDHRVVAL